MRFLVFFALLRCVFMISHETPASYVIDLGTEGNTVEYDPTEDRKFRTVLDNAGKKGVEIHENIVARAHYDDSVSAKKSMYLVRRRTHNGSDTHA